MKYTSLIKPALSIIAAASLTSCKKSADTTLKNVPSSTSTELISQYGYAETINLTNSILNSYHYTDSNNMVVMALQCEFLGETIHPQSPDFEVALNRAKFYAEKLTLTFKKLSNSDELVQQSFYITGNSTRGRDNLILFVDLTVSEAAFNKLLETQKSQQR